jgi:hypothetical protein
MEDRVNASARGQRQTIHHGAHALLHAERTVEQRRQFARGLVSNGGRHPLVKTKPNPVAHRKLHVMVATIVLVVHQLLGVQQALLDLGQELIAIT